MIAAIISVVCFIVISGISTLNSHNS